MTALAPPLGPTGFVRLASDAASHQTCTGRSQQFVERAGWNGRVGFGAERRARERSGGGLSCETELGGRKAARQGRGMSVDGRGGT